VPSPDRALATPLFPLHSRERRYFRLPSPCLSAGSARRFRLVLRLLAAPRTLEKVFDPGSSSPLCFKVSFRRARSSQRNPNLLFPCNSFPSATLFDPALRICRNQTPSRPPLHAPLQPPYSLSHHSDQIDFNGSCFPNFPQNVGYKFGSLLFLL